MNPLDSTRTAAFHVTIRDCLVGAWVARHDDLADAQLIDPKAQTWLIDVGGREHRGPAVDAAHHNSSDAVKDMLRHWAKEHHQLFD